MSSNRVKIGDLVNALLQAEEMERMRQTGGESVLRGMTYGQLHGARHALRETLTACTEEIELSGDTVNILVPFLSAVEMPA